ncbi:hypothetical protein SRHO_G00165740 [Serrasalmus rhombeus]
MSGCLSICLQPCQRCSERCEDALISTSSVLQSDTGRIAINKHQPQLGGNGSQGAETHTPSSTASSYLQPAGESSRSPRDLEAAAAGFLRSLSAIPSLFPFIWLSSCSGGAKGKCERVRTQAEGRGCCLGYRSLPRRSV